MPAPEARKAQQLEQIITFDEFDAGEFGSEAPWKAPKNSFTGLNVLRYVDGSIGPRNGLKEITLSGDAMTGVVNGWGRQLAVGGKNMWLIVDSTAYIMDTDGAVASLGAVSGGAPTEPPQSVPKGARSYVSSFADKLYKIDHDAATITAISTPNSPGLRCIAQYGERTLAGGARSVALAITGKAPDGTTAVQNRLYFSDASNPESWPAENFIDIGDSSADIRAIIPQRTHCVISMSDGSWWVLTGVPGVNPVLRTGVQSVSPVYPQHAVQIGSGNIAYCIASSSTNGSTAALGEFTGSQLVLNEKINYGDGRLTFPLPTYSVIPLKNIHDWFVTGGPNVAANRAALQQFGAWSLHQWQVSGVTLSGFCVSNSLSDDQHLFTDGGAASTTPKFYRWRAYNNRPGFTSDTRGQPGDGSTTPFTANFTLPEWYAPDGREVDIVAVTVDFTSWNTGSGSTNHFDITPTILRTYNGASVVGTAASFDEAGSSSAATIAGTRQRKRFDFSGLTAGNGFQLAFSALRGVAIQKIQVHISHDGPRF